MLIYRFETVGNPRRGPFYDNHARLHDRQAMMEGSELVYNMPCLFSDAEVGSAAHDYVQHNSYGEIRFGFSSKRSLVRAFTSFRGRRIMEEEGCFLFVYQVGQEDVIHGHHQVIFLRDKATLVARLDAGTLDAIELYDNEGVSMRGEFGKLLTTDNESYISI